SWIFTTSSARMASSASTIETGTPAARRRCVKPSSASVSVAPTVRRVYPRRTARPVTSFQPIARPPNRLTRLSVLLDRRNPPDRQRQIARMCELAKIDAVWAVFHAPDDDQATDAIAALSAAAEVTSQLRLGLVIADTGRAAEVVAQHVGGMV